MHITFTFQIMKEDNRRRKKIGTADGSDAELSSDRFEEDEAFSELDFGMSHLSILDEIKSETSREDAKKKSKVNKIHSPVSKAWMIPM